MTALAISDATTITFTVVGFFAFLALLAVARSALRKDKKHYRRVRMGFFIERGDADDPPQGRTQ